VQEGTRECKNARKQDNAPWSGIDAKMMLLFPENKNSNDKSAASLH